VEQGKQLSDALDEDRNLFGDFFITTVRSGEESGHIENALNQLADYLEKEDFIRSKLKKALSFPLLTMTMAILVVGFLLIYVIPTFAKVYEEAGVELPKITQVIISFSLFLKAFWIPILIALIVFIIFLTRSNRIPGLNRIMDRVKLMFPVIRNITIKTAVYRFARIASTMLDSGVPILTTLKLGAEATENGLFKNSILKACQDIDQGKSVEESLAKHSKFPPMVIDMIGVGEETGQMNVVLRKVAMFYERDVDDAVSNLTTALEPILTLGMGIIVVFIALSMFLPYFNISKVILH
jgi:type IV pilus assembly protein PilC